MVSALGLPRRSSRGLCREKLMGLGCMPWFGDLFDPRHFGGFFPTTVLIGVPVDDHIVSYFSHFYYSASWICGGYNIVGCDRAPTGFSIALYQYMHHFG
jgi:hypothetical protein